MIKHSLLALVALTGLSFAQTANLATTPAPRAGGWVKRHESFNEISKKGEAQLVFLGDSITAGWAGKGAKVWPQAFGKYEPANFGIGGVNRRSNKESGSGKCKTAHGDDSSVKVTY